MTTLRAAVDRYLALRRSLGFDLVVPGGLLRRFADFAERERVAFVTIDLVLRWAGTFGDALPSTVARAVGVVRGFAVWQAGFDQRTQPPPAGLLPGRYQRRRPFLHSDEQVAALVSASARLTSTKGLRGPTYSTFFGLIAATGLRMSEAVKLDRCDVDLDEGVLTIRRTKFGKTRLVPLHATTRVRSRAIRSSATRSWATRAPLPSSFPKPVDESRSGVPAISSHMSRSGSDIARRPGSCRAGTGIGMVADLASTIFGIDSPRKHCSIGIGQASTSSVRSQSS